MAVDNNDIVKTPVAEPQAPASAEHKGGGVLRALGHFLREVQVELKKTSWPSKNDLTKFTIVILVTITIVAIYLFVSDFVVGQIANRVFDVQGTTLPR